MADEDMEQLDIPDEGDNAEETQSMPEPIPEPVPAPSPTGSAWGWIGSPDRPEAQEVSDGISDLFQIDEEDLDAGKGLDDLTSVDFENDILDAGEDGTLDDLVNVSKEDIIGSPPKTKARYRTAPRRSYIPPTSMGGTR